jgi:hypothetical protein
VISIVYMQNAEGMHDMVHWTDPQWIEDRKRAMNAYTVKKNRFAGPRKGTVRMSYKNEGKKKRGVLAHQNFVCNRIRCVQLCL